MSDLITTFKKYETLGEKEFKKIVSSGNVNNLYIYSDNILESIDILGLIIQFSRYLGLLGIFYEPIDQPVYVFKERKGSKKILIKICGSYKNWDLPEEVADIVYHIDKPDFVIVDRTFKPIFVGETTGTANVGNSQWQREGRKIRPAEKNIPFVYQTYYSGTDRSQAGEPQVREPTSLQVINHIIYCLRYATPSFVIYYPSEYDQIIKRKRTSEGRGYLADYISVILLNRLDSKYSTQKKLLEKKILEHMLKYLNDNIAKTVKGKSRLFKFEKPRLKKDFLNIPKINLFTANREDLIKFIVERINGRRLNKKFDILDWDLSSFPMWGKYYTKLGLVKEILRNKIIIKSYRAKTKVGIIQDTPRLIKLLSKKYSVTESRIKKMVNKSLPTLFFPARIFKGEKKKLSGDPETGEITAFAELFIKDITNKKSMNCLIYAHIEPPKDYPILDQLKKTNGDEGAKIFKAIKKYGDLFIFNEKIILW